MRARYLIWLLFVAAAFGQQPVTTPFDATPATQNITAQDTGSTITSGANSQSIITGTATAGSTAVFTLATISNIRIQVTGTWTGTLQLEMSFDGGTTWYIHGARQIGLPWSGSTFTANFGAVLNSSAANRFRVRATATWTGTATITITQTTLNSAITYIESPIQLADATTPTQMAAVSAAGAQLMNQGYVGGSAVVADPCQQAVRTAVVINATASTQIITGTSGKQTYVCFLQFALSAVADNVALVEGTGSTCASSTAGMAGGSTAATGWNLLANGSVTAGSIQAWAFKTVTAADNVCLLASSAAQISGVVQYVQQ